MSAVLSDTEREFLARNHAAAMITLRQDGRPHVVRVGVALVDSKLWSSGVPSLVRTGHLYWEMQERTEEEFRDIMREQDRLIYEFDILRTYGVGTTG